MIVSIGGVLAAAAWAYYKVLSTPKETEHLGSPTPPLPGAAALHSISKPAQKRGHNEIQ